MVFCPIARGACPGRTKCRLWTRGRIQNSDTKLLATRLARFILSPPPEMSEKGENPSKVSRELFDAFWKLEGLPNIRQVCIIDRYLTEKVREVEELATSWLESPAFRATILATSAQNIKKTSVRCKPQSKCPP